jgi:hypothetical protein
MPAEVTMMKSARRGAYFGKEAFAKCIEKMTVR